MSSRTTVALDEEVLARVKNESRLRGASFRDTLNDLLRAGLLNGQATRQAGSLIINPTHMGYREGVNYDNIESLLELGEGEGIGDRHRRQSVAVRL